MDTDDDLRQAHHRGLFGDRLPPGSDAGVQPRRQGAELPHLLPAPSGAVGGGSQGPGHPSAQGLQLHRGQPSPGPGHRRRAVLPGAERGLQGPGLRAGGPEGHLPGGGGDPGAGEPRVPGGGGGAEEFPRRRGQGCADAGHRPCCAEQHVAQAAAEGGPGGGGVQAEHRAGKGNEGHLRQDAVRSDLQVAHREVELEALAERHQRGLLRCLGHRRLREL
mmetsp:Transcript_78724/g.188898  ORF Transcript_78724/g.188898 Transcript_78724/m.188898 type:complete len:219 (+) Transcript_78724:508-1164(+)